MKSYRSRIPGMAKHALLNYEFRRGFKITCVLRVQDADMKEDALLLNALTNVAKDANKFLVAGDFHVTRTD